MGIHNINFLKNVGTSLVIQWLKLYTAKAGGLVQSLIMELDPTCSNKNPLQPNK